MAHNLNTTNGQVAYFGRTAAWHVLGQVTGRHMTSAELLSEVCFAFVVFKSQLKDGLGRLVEAWGTFRWNIADKLAGNKEAAIFLSAVGSDYTCIQHDEGFKTVDAIMRTVDGAHYETAGVLGKGETVWALADLKLSFNVGAGDRHEAFLLFSTGHDGRKSHNYRLVVRRVVCENTLELAMSEATRASFTIRHSKNANERLVNARAALDAMGDDIKRAEDRLNFLAGKKMNREGVESIMDRLFPKAKNAAGEEKETGRRKGIIEDILHLYELNDGDKGFKEQRGTAYNLLNAITEYADHQRGTSKTTDEQRAETALFGSGSDLKARAYDAIYQTARSLPDVQQSVAVDWSSLGMKVGG